MPITPKASIDLTQVTDDIVARIFARQDAETPDPATTILPPSLLGYLETHKIPRLTVKTQTDSLVQRACQLVSLPHASEVIEVAVDVILEKLRGRGGGKGIGLLVSAAGFGCKQLVPLFSQRATTGIEPMTLPTPGRATKHAKLNESLDLVRGGNLHFNVNVLDVRCVPQTETLTAKPGHTLIAADVRIESQSDGIDYDAAYWDLTTDGVNLGYFVPTSDQSYVPYLTYGPLNAREVVEGWLLFHVVTPTKSIEVLYRGNAKSPVPVMQVDRGPCLNP